VLKNVRCRREVQPSCGMVAAEVFDPLEALRNLIIDGWPVTAGRHSLDKLRCRLDRARCAANRGAAGQLKDLDPYWILRFLRVLNLALPRPVPMVSIAHRL
jgi:hypothetical protein